MYNFFQRKKLIKLPYLLKRAWMLLSSSTFSIMCRVYQGCASSFLVSSSTFLLFLWLSSASSASFILSSSISFIMLLLGVVGKTKLKPWPDGTKPPKTTPSEGSCFFRTSLFFCRRACSFVAFVFHCRYLCSFLRVHIFILLTISSIGRQEKNAIQVQVVFKEKLIAQEIFVGLTIFRGEDPSFYTLFDPFWSRGTFRSCKF